MSTDSEDSEDLDKFKEAIDGSFLTENLYADNGSPKETKSPKKLPPSLRNQNHTINTINPFSIKVTPEFQKHVAKHLNKLLDEVINDNGVFLKSKVAKGNHPPGGVKLLRHSKNFLGFVEKSTKNKKILKHRKKSELLKDKDYTKRAKEVAVTGEWVLSKKETESWAPITKGEVEIIKLSDVHKQPTGLKKLKKKKKKKKKDCP